SMGLPGLAASTINWACVCRAVSTMTWPASPSDTRRSAWSAWSPSSLLTASRSADSVVAVRHRRYAARRPGSGRPTCRAAARRRTLRSGEPAGSVLPGRPAAARYGRAGSRLFLQQRSCHSPSGYLTVPRPPKGHITQSGTKAQGQPLALPPHAVQVEVSMSEQDAVTRVRLVTSLEVTGKQAQFGRGVMSDIAAKLTDQFAACL